jgi:hypothetical protein
MGVFHPSVDRKALPSHCGSSLQRRFVGAPSISSRGRDIRSRLAPYLFDPLDLDTARLDPRKALFMLFQIVTLALLAVGVLLGRKLLLAHQANALLSSEVAKLRRRLRIDGR